MWLILRFSEVNCQGTIIQLDLFAGATGVEPVVAVLETAGLPLTDAPRLLYNYTKNIVLFYFNLNSLCSVVLRQRAQNLRKVREVLVL